MSSELPKGPKHYDLQAVEPSDFETLAFLLAHAENRDVVVVRNKDEGLDARLPDPLGRLTLRGWQAKRYPPTKIHWRQCEESLEDAVAWWRPMRVTFVFTHDLSAADQTKFRTRLAEAHPYLRVDWWGDTEVQRLLRDTDEGRNAARWLFESAETIDDLLAALVSKEPVRTQAEIAKRQAELLDRLNSGDPHFYYTTVARPAGSRETPPAPDTFVSVVLVVGGAEVRYDLQEKYPGALDDLGGAPLLVVSDDEKGEEARTAIEAALHATGPTRIASSVGVHWPAVPVGLRGLVSEEAWGEIEITSTPTDHRLTHEEPAFTFMARAGDASLGMEFVLSDETQAGYEQTLIAAIGGLELLMSVRGKEGKPLKPGNMETRLDWRHTLGIGHALDQLLSCRLLSAVLGGASIALTHGDNDGEMVASGPDMRDEEYESELARHEEFLTLVCELQAWLGRPLEPKARPTPEDATELGRALGLIREPRRRGTWREISVRLAQKPPAGPLEVVILEPVYATLFGSRVYLGIDLITLPSVHLASSDDDTRLIPADSDKLVARLQHPDEAPPEAAKPRGAEGYGRVLVRELTPSQAE